MKVIKYLLLYMFEYKKQSYDDKIESKSLSNYEKIERIGKGGFGKVYLCKNKKKSEKVVIKKVITSTEEYLNGSEEYYSYVDTFNSVHLEGDLVNYETAAKLTGVIYFIGGGECSGIADNSVV